MLSKIIEIIEKTGDKFILPDLKSGENYVIMRLSDYEKLLSLQKTSVREVPGNIPLTSDEKSANISANIPMKKTLENDRSKMEQSQDRYYFEPLE